MLIDFFTYTSATTGGRLEIDDLLERADEAGLDGFVVVDNEYSVHAEELRAAAEDSPLLVGVGVEIGTDKGPVVCIPSEIDSFLVDEEWRDLTTFGEPNAQDAIDMMAEVGGAVIVRKVYDRGQMLGDSVFRLDGLDGIDALNPRRERIRNELALEAAIALGISAVGGSTVLTEASEMGSVATMLLAAVDTQAELVEAVKSGDMWPAALGRPGKWAPSGERGKSKGKRRRGKSKGKRRGKSKGKRRGKRRRGGRGKSRK